MNKQLSPDLAERKAMLMAQLDSLSEDQLPDKINPLLIKQALRLYKNFHYLAFNNDGMQILESLNNSIFCNAQQDNGGGLFGSDIIALTTISNFMAKNIDILQEYTES